MSSKSHAVSAAFRSTVRITPTSNEPVADVVDAIMRAVSDIGGTA